MKNLLKANIFYLRKKYPLNILLICLGIIVGDMYIRFTGKLIGCESAEQVVTTLMAYSLLIYIGLMTLCPGVSNMLMVDRLWQYPIISVGSKKKVCMSLFLTDFLCAGFCFSIAYLGLGIGAACLSGVDLPSLLNGSFFKIFFIKCLSFLELIAWYNLPIYIVTSQAALFLTKLMVPFIWWFSGFSFAAGTVGISDYPFLAYIGPVQVFLGYQSCQTISIVVNLLIRMLVVCGIVLLAGNIFDRHDLLKIERKDY